MISASKVSEAASTVSKSSRSSFLSGRILLRSKSPMNAAPHCVTRGIAKTAYGLSIIWFKDEAGCRDRDKGTDFNARSSPNRMNEVFDLSQLSRQYTDYYRGLASPVFHPNLFSASTCRRCSPAEDIW